ncbi:MAG: peptidoglycan-binding protein [bacterium]|nr:peptidoglycan-binding protein [bacterium]
MSKKALIILMLMVVLPFSMSAQEVFTRNLYFGLLGNPDVTKLQEFLRRLGFFTYPASNGNYLWTTVGSVKRFQQTHGVYPASGYFGTKTRVAANRIAATKDFITEPVISPQKTKQTQTPVLRSTESPYKNKIKITYVDGYGNKPEKEVVYIENWNSDEKINVTGFTLESIRGTKLEIPVADALPGPYGSSARDPVVLKPGGGKVIVVIGKHPNNTNFQTNLCTGYFSENYKFEPSLNNRCPRVETRKLPLNISDRCIDVINSTPTCRQPDYSQIFPINDEDCRSFLSKHFNYVGCVADNRDRADFFGNDWYIWLGRPEEFLRDNREVIILRDREGREVDKYSY